MKAQKGLQMELKTIVVKSRKEAEALYRMKVHSLMYETIEQIEQEIQANYPNMEIERGSLIAQATIQASKLQEIPLILIDQSSKE